MFLLEGVKILSRSCLLSNVDKAPTLPNQRGEVVSVK
jgi:hypothetical protein